MADQTLSAEDRLAAGDNPTIAALHETHPLRDGISPSQPQRFKVERPKSSFAAWYQFFPRSEGATIDPNTGKIIQGTLKTSMAGPRTRRCRGLRHRLPAAGLPDWRDQPQGPQQHAGRRPR